MNLKPKVSEFESSQERRPKISVALCTYNGVRFLGEQLASIASQSRLPDEVIICDDVSSDSSLRLARDFAKTSPFEVEVYQNTSRLGSSKNFEQAIGFCTGDIIVLCDQDDIWHPRRIESIEVEFDASPDFGGVLCDGVLINAQGERLGRSLWRSVGFGTFRRNAVREGRGFDLLLQGNFVTGAAFAFRSTWKDLVLPIPIGWVHDHWIALLIAAVSRFDFVDAPLIEYRCHPEQERGVKNGGLREIWHHFNSLDHHAYLEAATMRGEIADRLRGYDAISFSRAIAKCEAYVKHSKRRGNLPSNRLLRLPGIIREVVNGSYFYHSAGLKSILRDIFVSY